MAERRAICLDAAAPDLTVRGLAAQRERLRSGGVDAVLATVGVLEPPAVVLAELGRWWAAHADAAQPARIATTVTELRSIVAAGELAVVLHFQGAAPLGGQVDLLDAYRRLGVRAMQLTYNHRADTGDGCLESADAGLSDLGRSVLARMEQLGILPDISHASPRTSRDVLRHARGPVIATHANVRAVCESPRNLHDDVIDGIAASGGVIGMCAFPSFVACEQTPTAAKLVDHVVYIAERVGVEHVGLGLDFADEDEEDFDYYGYDERWYPRPPWVWPEGIAAWEETCNLRTELGSRGFSAAEIDGVMGENFLRVFAHGWGA